MPTNSQRHSLGLEYIPTLIPIHQPPQLIGTSVNMPVTWIVRYIYTTKPNPSKSFCFTAWGHRATVHATRLEEHAEDSAQEMFGKQKHCPWLVVQHDCIVTIYCLLCFRINHVVSNPFGASCLHPRTCTCCRPRFSQIGPPEQRTYAQRYKCGLRAERSRPTGWVLGGFRLSGSEATEDHRGGG